MITKPMWDKGIMAIDLDNLYEELLRHFGHRLTIVTYGLRGELPYAVALECETCDEVLLDAEKEN